MDYVKYPRTWHLPDSPNRGADGDHAYADYSSFAGREVVVTEKLDGENTFGRHSIAYDALPSYFQLFAVYDADAVCLSWDDTAGWARRLGVDLVPLLYRGVFDHAQVVARLGGASAFGPEREGVVLRWADAFAAADHQRAAGKLVRRDHVKTEDHWMHGEVSANGLASRP